MSHHFTAANAWLAVALALTIGEWGPGDTSNLFGYGRIKTPVYAAAVVAAVSAAAFCAHRWLRAGAGGAPGLFFALGQAWLVIGLFFLLGMQTSRSRYQLFGYGRITPPAYWGVVTGAFGAAAFALIRWGRTRGTGGPTAGQDLARVGLAAYAVLGVYAADLLFTDKNPPRFPDDVPALGGGILLYLTLAVWLARKVFGPATPAPPRRVQSRLSGGVRVGLATVGVAAVGLVVVTVLGAARYSDRLEVWYVCLVAVGLLGSLVLLVAVLTDRAGRRARARPAERSPVRSAPDATLQKAGLTALAVILFVGLLPAVQVAMEMSGGLMWMMLLAVGLAVAVTVVFVVLAWPTVRPKPTPAAPPCPTCAQPIPAGAPGGLCPRCLLKGAAENPSPTLAFVESYTPPDVESVRARFPHLEVVRLIGQGGMGAVYLARQPALDRHVALKLVRQRPDDPTFAERFAREARAMARLSHPNVVAVHESGEAGGLPYLVMEYVAGTTLRDAMRAKALAPAAALAVVRQVCDALEYAHRQGVVHRDIKPENILLELGGAGDPSALRVKIADFGLAKVADRGGVSLTGTWQAVGTPHYMAPEQWEQPAAVDHRADIFALGVVLYELLTGELPLGRFDPPSQKIEVDVRVDEVVLRALAKEPDRRYQHAREVKTDLENIRPDP